MSYPTSSYTRWAKMSIDFSANFAPQSKFVQNQRKLVPKLVSKPLDKCNTM